MNNQILLPNSLPRGGTFFTKISQSNDKVYSHIEYIRQLVIAMHQMYSQLCKKMTQTAETFQRKIVNVFKGSSKHGDLILDFVKSISYIHYSINNQLNSNNVALGTKTNRIVKNRLDVIRQRLRVCELNHREYIKSVDNFNDSLKEFNNECEYFSDYEKDVLKYYSLKLNVERHQKLVRKEIRLKQQRQDILLKKLDYQENVHECRTLIKQYFQMQKSLIGQYSKLLLNVRYKANIDRSQVYAQPIMQEPSNEMQSNSNKMEIMMTRHSEKQLQKTIASMRKDIIKEEEHTRQLQQLLQKFLIEFQYTINAAGKRIDEIRDEKAYGEFVSEKIQMNDTLPADSIRQIDLVISQITLFRTIILNLETHLGKIKLLQQIKKYRQYNYEKFIDETAIYSDKRGSVTQSSRTDYYKLEYKYLDRNIEYLSKYQERIIDLKDSIMSEYYREDLSYNEPKSLKNIPHNVIFAKINYEILMDPFFLNKSNNNQIYQENPYLTKLSSHLSANQIQTTMTLQGFNKKGKGKRSCCGFFESDEVQVEKTTQIDDFHCSLKDGIILIRGKLKLYQNYIRFTSSFNSKTLFGSSDIRVPKWNIIRIVSGKHILVQKITVQTTHGDLQFTDFFNSPYNLLVETYETKKTGVTTLDKHNMEDTEVALLQQRFQSDFGADLLKLGIHIDKLSTYLSEDRQKLSISTQYHLSKSSFHSLFEIKIFQKGITIQYIFFHDNKCRNTQTKTLLEKASKDLINRKQAQSSPSAIKLGRLSNLDCSIIEANEQNKLSFVKEPSFIMEKKNNNQNQNSINFLPDFEKKGSPPLTTLKRTQSQDDDNFILKQTFRGSDDGTNPRSSWLKFSNLTIHRDEEIKKSSKIGAVVKQDTSRNQKKSVGCQGMESTKRKATTEEKSNECSPNYRVVLYIISFVLLLNIIVKIFVQ